MKSFILLAALFSPFLTTAQVKQIPPKKLDSVAQKVIAYFKVKQPDSIYAMTGKAFRDKITPENFSSITTTKILPLTDFKNVKFISSIQGISKYKVEGNPTLQLLIGLDVDDKIQTLLVQEYIPD